ncbi:MAG: hypothetical protein Q7K42_04430, partial [Candidatus Diapherotrites archaeon]|nr:hypothetical protein [Candidatus Diapherotrites archaeon]
GNLQLTLPSATPGSKFLLEFGLEGFHAESKLLSVSQDIVSFEPAEIEFKLNTLTKQEEVLSVKLTNKIDRKLKIKDARFTGYFKGYFNELSMNEFLAQNLGNEFVFGQENSKTKFKTILAKSLDLSTPDTVQGKLHLTLESTELKKSWVVSIPFKAVIESQAKISLKNCLVIEGTQVPVWDTISEGGRIATEFTLVNRCKSDNKEIELKNLKAIVEFSGNKIGDVELSISELEAGEKKQTTLRQGEYSQLTEKVKSGETIYNGVIYFSPNNLHIGEKTEFNVKFKAELPGSAAGEVEASQTITGKISLVQFSDCMKFNPTLEEGFKLSAGEEEKTFEV